MKEEHLVVATDRFAIRQRVALVPRHACTAANLFERAMVRLLDGSWVHRAQLGARPSRTACYVVGQLQMTDYANGTKNLFAAASSTIAATTYRKNSQKS
jgi:hypothetical protein